MVNVPIGKPWEFIAVDILKVPPSFRGNTYLLVLQDYFTKWLEAVPLADQKAETIVKQLVKIFSTFGMPKYLHSDQGTNFESTILQKTCAAFGIIKTRTTAYHPQGDGMVERSNRSILQMLRSFTSSSSDWEDHLPLLLFAYRTSFHRSTKATPFTLMFGRDVADSIIPTDSTNAARDTITYEAELVKRLAEMYEIVEGNLAEAGSAQKTGYDSGTVIRSDLNRGVPVWLSVPTASKLDSRWEGGWTVDHVNHDGVTRKITHADGRNKVVHINRLRKHVLRNNQPTPQSQTTSGSDLSWEPPPFEHEIIDDDPPPTDPPSVVSHSRPQRQRRVPDRYGFS